MKRFAAVVSFLLAATAGQAAEDGALSLSPSVVMLRGEPGQSTTQTLTLTNGTSRAFTFALEAQDVVVRDGKRVFVEAGELPGSIAATAIFSQKTVEVAPGASVSVAMTVTLPPNVQTRAVAPMFRGTNRVMSGNVPMLASLGALFTFTLSDQLELSAEPLQVRPQSAAVNLAVSHRCVNSGTEPFVVRGVIAVLDVKGALAGKAAIEPRRLLPGEAAQLGGEYGGELAPGGYRVLVTYEFGGKTLTRSAEVTIR